MKNVIKADALSVFNAAMLSTTLTPINAAGFAGPVAILRIINDSDVPVAISYDGALLNDYIGAGDALILDLQTNASPNNYVSMLRKSSKVYIYGGVAGTGNIYLAAYYLEF